MGNDEKEAAKALVDLPLCIVYLIEEEAYFLALTGGGMDLTWQICEAYMRLGYLPPTHFSRLPRYAGATLNSAEALTNRCCSASGRAGSSATSSRCPSS